MPEKTTALISSAMSPIGKFATVISDWLRGSRPATPTPIWRDPPRGLACKLIGNFAQAEVKMLKYVETNAARCGIPPQIHEQLKRGHQGTEALQKKVCTAAAQMQKGPSGPTLSDILGSSTALPEVAAAKKGGTFDTLNGNALQR